MQDIYAVCDRFEGDFAILIADNEKKYQISRSALEAMTRAEMHESDVILITTDKDSIVNAHPDIEETKRRHAAAKERLNRLLTKNK